MLPQFDLKDPQLESRIYGIRTIIAICLVVASLGVVLMRYYTLQITEYEIYRTQSERNRVQLQPLPPTARAYLRPQWCAAGGQSAQLHSFRGARAGGGSGCDPGGAAGTGADFARAIWKISTRNSNDSRPYEAVPLRFRLTEEERARLAVNRFRLPGVVVEAQLLRYYPHGELFSHALGYVGRINEQEAQELDETDYRGTFHVGKVGVEKYYEDILHGDVGYQNVESNAHGRVLRVLERFAPAPGKDLTLSLDYRVQRAAFDALGDRRGAVVAIDPRTGGVLALVSTPGFDTNLFVNGISSSDYAALRDSLDVPLFNRAIQGTYPPGSTIKPFMAMAGLLSGLVTPESTVRRPGLVQPAR